MDKAETTEGVVPAGQCWRWMLVAGVVFSLTIFVATRTFRVITPHGITVKAGATHGMRQHMNRDAGYWTPPVPVFTILQTPTFHPQVVLTGRSVGALLLDDNLCNRPPPSC